VDSSTKAYLASAVSAMAGFWGGFDPMVKTLAVLMFLDVVSGGLLAASTRTVSSDASFHGMAKKAMMLVLVGAAHVYNATQPLGFDASAGVASFFATTELISIFENAGRLGLPIPKPLVDVFEKLRSK
jgi:toxin secretion/phage lysis holin